MKKFKRKLPTTLVSLDHYDLEADRLARIDKVFSESGLGGTHFPEDFEEIKALVLKHYPNLRSHQVPVNRHDCIRLLYTHIHWEDFKKLEKTPEGGIIEVIGRTPIARSTMHPDNSAKEIQDEVMANLENYLKSKMLPRVTASLDKFKKTAKAIHAQKAVKATFERRLVQLNGGIQELKENEAKERVFPKHGGFQSLLENEDFFFKKPIAIERVEDIPEMKITKYNSIFEYAVDRKLMEGDREDGSTFQFYSRPHSFFFNQSEIIPVQTELFGDSDVFTAAMFQSYKFALLLASNLGMGIQTPREFDEMVDEMRDTSFVTRIPDERSNAFTKSGFRVVGWSFSSYGAIFEEMMKGVNKTYDARVEIDPKLVYNEEECELSQGICLVMKHDADPRRVYFVDFKVQNEMVTVEEMQSFFPRKYTCSGKTGSLNDQQLDHQTSFFHTCARSFRMKNDGEIIEEFDLILDESHANFGPDEATKCYMAKEHNFIPGKDGHDAFFDFDTDLNDTKYLTNGFLLSRFLYSINPNIPACNYAFSHIPTPTTFSNYARDNAVELPYLYNHNDVNAFNVQTEVAETSLFSTDFPRLAESLESLNPQFSQRSRKIYNFVLSDGESEDRLIHAADGANRFYVYNSVVGYSDEGLHAQHIGDHLVRLFALDRMGKLPQDKRWEIDEKMNSRALKLAHEITGLKTIYEYLHDRISTIEEAHLEYVAKISTYGTYDDFFDYQAFFTVSGKDTRVFTTYAELEWLDDTRTSEDLYAHMLKYLESQGKNARFQDDKGRLIKGWDKIKKYLKVS